MSGSGKTGLSLQDRGRRTNKEPQFFGDSQAFRLAGDGNGLNRAKGRQEMEGNRRRIGVNRNADHAGAGDLGVRMGVGRFQPGKQQSQAHTGQGEYALPAPDFELVVLNQLVLPRLPDRLPGPMQEFIGSARGVNAPGATKVTVWPTHLHSLRVGLS